MRSTLDYEQQPAIAAGGRAGLAMVLAVAVVAYALSAIVATTAVGLHNEHPFLWLPLVSGAAATGLIAIAARERRRAKGGFRRSVRACGVVWAVSTSFTLLGVYGAVFGVDPHVIGYESNDCPNNLRSLYAWIDAYADEHGGAYPASANAVLADMATHTPGQFGQAAERFVCPYTNDTPTTAPTTQAAIAGLTTGGHLSYVYLAGGLKKPCPPGAVLVYEPLGHHRHVNYLAVVRADGTVERVTGRRAERMQADLEAGRNPPAP